ncbi:MAG: lysophospholipid acyltransferase family protein [Tepidisphaeraceae bacterium]|jgi:1-acyl-sn-glycerol-3-phosphate acyltransferase
MNQRSVVWKLLQIIARVGTTVLFDLKTYGSRNVPKSGGVLLVANHQSYLDPVLVAVHLDRPVSYLAKSELFENPYFAWFIRSLHAFPVRQGEGDVGAVREMIRLLEKGNVLNVFPEGSRTETGEIAPLEKGVALVIRKAGVPVVPVAIDGSFAAWPKDAMIFHPHPVRVRYGKPIDFHGKKGQEIICTLETELRSLMAELRASERPANA